MSCIIAWEENILACFWEAKDYLSPHFVIIKARQVGGVGHGHLLVQMAMMQASLQRAKRQKNLFIYSLGYE